jgi:hypothetical protein
MLSKLSLAISSTSIGKLNPMSLVSRVQDCNCRTIVDADTAKILAATLSICKTEVNPFETSSKCFAEICFRASRLPAKIDLDD